MFPSAAVLLRAWAHAPTAETRQQEGHSIEVCFLLRDALAFVLSFSSRLPDTGSFSAFGSLLVNPTCDVILNPTIPVVHLRPTWLVLSCFATVTLLTACICNVSQTKTETSTHILLLLLSLALALVQKQPAGL